jgi:hypothetical protein
MPRALILVVKHRLLLVCGLCLWALSAQPAYADPVMTSPGETVLRTGAVTTFEAAPSDPGYTWDLDGDGVTDKTGSPVTWAYPRPGPVTVTVRAPNGQGETTKELQIVGPSPDFLYFPASPLAGQPIQFVYSSHEATEAIEWDLDGDGQFEDARGAFATTTFALPGTYAVSVRVTGIEEPPPPARSTSTQLVNVSPAGSPLTNQGKRQFRLMSPFPVVRITGKVLRRGALIKSLTIRAPYGATVKVRCRGRGCPFRRSSRTLARVGKAKGPAKTIRIKKLSRRVLRGGASIKVLVSRPGEIGKYTRFLIRRGKPPRRTDLCLLSGMSEPIECPGA